jgi:hypothetical protein
LRLVSCARRQTRSPIITAETHRNPEPRGGVAGAQLGEDEFLVTAFRPRVYFGLSKPAPLESMMMSRVEDGRFDDGKWVFRRVDGLRDTAAIAVVIFHLCEYLFPDPASNPLRHADLAVDFFFLLSGFVIAHAYDRRWPAMSVTQGHRMIDIGRIRDRQVISKTAGRLLGR